MSRCWCNNAVRLLKRGTDISVRVDPALGSMGKRLDSILCDIARLPLSPPMEELLARHHQAEAKEGNCSNATRIDGSGAQIRRT